MEKKASVERRNSWELFEKLFFQIHRTRFCEGAFRRWPQTGTGEPTSGSLAHHLSAQANDLSPRKPNIPRNPPTVGSHAFSAKDNAHPCPRRERHNNGARAELLGRRPSQ